MSFLQVFLTPFRGLIKKNILVHNVMMRSRMFVETIYFFEMAYT
jgi:hypothetical protein